MAIKQEILTDDKDHQRALEKAQKQIEQLEARYVKLASTQRRNAGETRRQQKESDGAILSQLAGLVKVDIGLRAVGAAVGFVRSAYQDWQGEMAKLAEQSRKTNESIIRDLALTGDLAQGKELATFFQSGAETTAEQRSAAYRGVRGALPFESLDRIKELTVATERVAALGLDLEKFGGGVGDVAGALPGKSAADLADFALLLQQTAGDKAEQVGDPGFQRATSLLRRAGFSSEQSLALGIKALEADVGAKQLEALAAKIDESSGTTRAKLMAGDRATLQKELGTQGFKLGEIDFAAADKLATEFTRKAAGDYIGEQLAAAGLTVAGSELAQQQQLDADLERANRRKAFSGRQLDDARKLLGQREGEGDLGLISKAVGRTFFEGFAAFSQLAGSETPGVDALNVMNAAFNGGQRGPAVDQFITEESRQNQLLLEETREMRKTLEGIRGEQLNKEDARRERQTMAPRDLASHNEW